METRKKVKFVGEDWLEYALFIGKEYEVIYESNDNYMVYNEVHGNSVVPKDRFVDV